jgi:plastocyanin
MDSKIAVAVGLAAVLAAVLAPISTLTPAYAATITAEITSGSSSKTTDSYAPNPINAKVGDTVTWTNKDSTIHTVTSGSNGQPDGKFDSSPNSQNLMAPQAKFSHTFEEAGEFPYYCALHPNMVGTVIVAGGGGNGGTPQETKVTATLEGKSYDITVKSATSKATEATIQSGQSVTIKFDKPGEVELTFPKTMIDGINDVSAGGTKINVTPTTSGDSSTIKFAVPEGSTTVVIKGAKVVPEFPVIAAILAATIAGIISYTRFAKSGTGLFGRA